MKRHFLTGLKAFAVGALAFAAVSCYDDQPIWDEIEGLKDRVTALEEKLNTEVATINTTLGTLKAADEKLAADIAAVVADVKKVNETLTTLDAYDKTLDGKIADLNAALAAFEDEATKQLAAAIAQIAVVKAEKNEAGNYVLTFADGKTLEVAAADANANNTGVITTVEVDGVTYWAVIGADGKTKVLDAAVHPDTKLQFKVDPETNELLVTYDGKTWEQTDVIVNDDTTFNVVTDFEDGEDYVTITVGGEEYQLPKYVADNSSLVLGRKNAYFVYGATKEVELTAEDVTEYYVMSKPDGWKAAIDGTTLTVTAPAKALIDLGAAEAEGEVLVHATAATGVCKVVKLDVTAGEALKVSIKDGVVTLFNALLAPEKDFWTGEVIGYAFTDVWFGLTPIAEYAEYESFEAFMATKPETLSNLQVILFNNVDDQENYIYKDGEYEEFVSSMSLVDIVEGSYSGFELDEEEVYVMWVVPQEDVDFNYDEGVYVITDSYVEIEDTESLYNNVSMDALFYGADGFVVGATDKAQFDNGWDVGVDGRTYEDALEEYLVGNYMPGPLANFNGGDLTAMGDMFVDGAHSLNLEDVIISAGMGGGMMPMPGMGAGSSVSPDAEYFVWVLPYYEDKVEYTFEDLVLLTVKTAPLVENPAIKATVTLDEVTATSVVISLVPAEGGSTAYELMTAESFEEFMIDGSVDKDMLVDYMKGGWAITEEDLWGDPAYVDEYGDWMIKPSTSYVYVTYNKVGGEYSIDYSVTFTTPAEVELPTPDNAQWMFRSTSFDDVFGGGATPDYLFDLNVSIAEQYGDSMGFTACLAVDYEDIYGADAAGFWAAPVYSAHTVAPTDETSGVITFNGMEIPYSDLAETTCTFDFSEFFMEDAGTVVVEATLVETPIVVNPQ